MRTHQMRTLKAMSIPVLALALALALIGFALLSSVQMDATAVAAPATQETDQDAETVIMTPTQSVTESMTMTEMETIRDADEMMEGDEPEEMEEDIPESPVLIQLQDKAITVREFNRAFVRAMHMFANQQGVPINDTTYDFFADLRDQYLEQFTLEQTLLAEAEAQGLIVSEDEAAAQLQRFKSSFPDEASYRAAVRSMGFADEAELIQYVQESNAVNAVLAGLRVNIGVSEDEVEAFYQDNVDLFRVEPGIILPLEQVDELVMQAVERQKLAERIAELRAQQLVEIFTGNMTPFDELMLSELGIADEAPSLAGAPDTIGQTATLTDVISIQVGDQVIPELTLVVDRVFKVGPGWIVVHADDDGAPGPVLGYEAVPDGVTENIAVVLDKEPTSNVLWAMLHEDTGETNVFDFPDADPPVTVDDNVVMEMITVLDMGAVLPEETEDETGEAADVMTETPDIETESTLDVAEEIGAVRLQVLMNDVYGSHLASETGQALYTYVSDFTDGDGMRDDPCDAMCARAWPPVLTDSVPHTMKDDMDAALAGTVDTPLGLQATFNDHPLHYSLLDAGEGDTSGHGVESFGVTWYLIAPDGTVVPVPPVQ